MRPSPHPLPQLSGTWAPLAVSHMDQVSAVATHTHAHSTISPTCYTGRYCTYPPRYLKSWPGSGDGSGQALCRSLAIAPSSTGSLVPPGPCPPRPRLWPARQVAPAEPIYRVHALAPLATQSQLASGPSTRLSHLSLSLPLRLRLSLPPSLPPIALVVHATCNHVHSLSTNWRLLGSDRDTKTKLGTNPSISSKLLWSQDRHLSHLLTSRPVQLLLSLCVLEARSSCFLGLHRVYFFSAATPEIAQLPLTPSRLLLAHVPVPVPRALLVPAATSNRTHPPSTHTRRHQDST